MTRPSPLVVLTLVALGATAWLVRGYLDAVVVAAVVTVLLGPLHTRVVRSVGGRRRFASLLTLGGFTIGVFVPATLLGVVVTREMVALANQLAAEAQVGEWDTRVAVLLRSRPGAWVVDLAGGPEAVLAELDASVRDAVLTFASTITQKVPTVVSVTASAILNVVVFFLATATLLARGPELVAFTRRVSPLSEANTDRLLAVFAEFARNVVLAGLVAGLLQGVVATAGFLLAGVERALLFGVLTAVFAYVPLIGTALVWVPVCLLLLAEQRAGAAMFVAAWSLLLTGTVDNVVRPFIVRGRSDVPLLLVFLGAFGGLATFGVIGLLVGPVMVAMLLALLRIYAEEQAVGVTDRPGPPAPSGPATPA